ncbi:hypothetical protein N7452_001438 [Penicillium brevicompactum]|uniref:Uncharacterized protein n=1 Tax=Penicillium brevicompactum TaxID=5074 RepID=A0A9W9UQ36_PENBR|nr:hypothetical protein N7452_001438 [Penicillium brevicompactum]
MAEQANTDTGSLMSGLPPSHVVRHYTTFRDLDAEARKVLQSLQANRDGNQYMVLLNVSARVRDKLDNDHKTCLGAIEYRFQWEGTTGFIKDVPSERHDIATDIMVKNIDRLHNDMGLPISDSIWARTTTYSSGSGRGKQADDSFVPRSRLPHDAVGWSLMPEGRVRIVLLISIRPTNIVIEKWQLAPVDAPMPLTQLYIDSLRDQKPSYPPLVLQPTSMRQAYSAQEIYIAQNQVKGGPLILPFSSVHDRQAVGAERDLVLSDQHLAVFSFL